MRLTVTTGSLSSVTVAGNAPSRGGHGGTGGTGSGSGSGGAGGSGGIDGTPGGVFVQAPPAATLQDSIVASNAAGNCLSTGGPITDLGHNLSFGDASCPGINGDPKLGPLQDNGGPTQTMGLQGGSAAVDQVPANGAGGCQSSDQRGVVRPHAAACDIGAFELAGPDVTTSAATSITSAGATLNGSVNANQSSASVHFEFGTTSSYDATTGSQQVGGVGTTAVRAQLTSLSPNTTYHYRLLATSPDGSQAGGDQTFTTGAAPPSGGASAPSIGHLSIKPASFRAKKRTHHRRDKAGTSISYTDSQSANATFTIWRCTKVKKHRGCVRYAQVATFAHTDKVGRNSFRWNGSVGRKPLKPGRYRLDLTARTGRLTGNKLSALFRIVS